MGLGVVSEVVSVPKQPGFSKANSMLKKLPTKKKTASDKKSLLSYLSGEYGITYFDKMFVYKLEHIHEGTLQNLQSPIQYSVLLDMFQYYKNDLEERRVYNRKVGKGFSERKGILSYDLAILLSKHPDYLIALEEEKARATETAKPQPTAKLVNYTPVNNTASNDEINIDEMLEDW